MKTLTLLRHAKSSWDDPVLRDFDRPLNARGRKAARAIGRELRSLGCAYDMIIASPAVRVVETLADTGEAYGRPLDARLDPELYLASPAVLLDCIHSADDAAQSLLLVGHNPGLELLALALSAEDGTPQRQALELKYPTAAVAEISFDVDRWSDVKEGGGTLIRFIRPRDLDPELGPDE